ncbi:hypothetical protein EMIHUDRAFT_446670, partial [Emiliania huxleyi CCMP1516]|uniref:Fungal lipase-type domain-containing protein n=2 Tax=Emiliania huxleyi TaxID=2903 RepID=A0A0D3HZ87_EMIH1
MQADASVPWISHLFRTGEALALQALASDYTVSLQHDACGSSVEHSIRDAEGEKLGPSFRYKVLGVFGVEGRCVAFAPHHTPGTLVLAFRGTRVDSNAASRPGRGQAAPPSEDIKALLNSSMVGVKWLPDAAMRVHAGVHRHHADLWDAEHSTRGSSLRLDQLGEGLGGWLAGLCGADAPQQIVFVGLSLGAALAQMSALRLASEQPQLAARTSVLGLGSFQFANADVGRLFESLYGERAAQLVTARRMPARPPPQVGWWVQEPPRDDEAQAEALVAAAVRRSRRRLLWRRAAPPDARDAPPLLGRRPRRCGGGAVGARGALLARLEDEGGGGAGARRARARLACRRPNHRRVWGDRAPPRHPVFARRRRRRVRRRLRARGGGAAAPCPRGRAGCSADGARRAHGWADGQAARSPPRL